MLHIEGYEWIVYFLSLLSVMLLGSLSSKTIKSKFKVKTIYLKKVCLAVFIATSIYWIITFPYVTSYYNFSGKSEYPANISAEKEIDFIKEHHLRIESLETELKETKDELKAVTGRLHLILQILMYGLIYFGARWIFTPSTNVEKNQSILKLDQ